MQRRLAESIFLCKYFVDDGLNIGRKSDSLSLWNQYKGDVQMMKKSNQGQPPFDNDSVL